MLVNNLDNQISSAPVIIRALMLVLLKHEHYIRFTDLIVS